MKPIIVTYSNESYELDAPGWIGIRNTNLWGYPFYYCTRTVKGVFRDSVHVTVIYESDIKLIARPKQLTDK